MNALALIPAVPTITGTFYEGRGIYLRQWVDLSDGRQLLLKYDATHEYVNVSLHQSDTDERGTDVAYDGAALSVGAVAALVDAFSARVERERA